MGIKDKIREKTVGAKKQFKEKKVWIDEDDDLYVIVKEPSVAQRTQILQKAQAQSAGVEGDFDKIDTGKMQVYAIINCTYTPDGEKVFDEADVENMLNTPTTVEWLDEVGEVAMNLMNVQEDEGKN